MHRKGIKMMRNTWKRKVLTGLLTAAVALSTMPVAFAANTESGTPYTVDGVYDVEVPHVLVNQIYGGSDDGVASHSFIELYNPCDVDIDLNGWELQYRSSADGSMEKWEELSLTGAIKAQGYYLIRCGAVDGTADYQVPEGDQQWDIQLHNKGVSVALFCKNAALDEGFAGAVTDGNRPEGYVDLLAVQGNDAEEAQAPVAYEGQYAPEQSKKKAIRRIGFIDTDDNSSDIEVIDYSEAVTEDKGPHNSQMNTGGAEEPETPDTPEEPSAPQTPVFRNTSFEEQADLTLSRLSSISIGETNPDGGVAEIVAYNSDTKEAYVVNGQDGLLYRFDVQSDGMTLKDSKNVKDLVEGFAYGDMTSVAVDTVGDKIAVALQAENYAEPGCVVLMDYDLNVTGEYQVGVQPDMVTFTPDGTMVLAANEGEPRDGYGEGAVDPEGSVSIISLINQTVTNAGFDNFDAQTLVSQGVLIGKVNGRLNDAANDLEPEYIATSSDSKTAYVTLQEANAIATVDLSTKEVTQVQSLGFKDLGQDINAIDLVEDGAYTPKTYSNAEGVYMPDGINVYEANGTRYLVTANEGDAREWGDYCNEIKENVAADDGTVAEKVRVIDTALTAVPDDGKTYLFGGRSFAIYNADTMEQVYDSGNAFEAKTAGYLPAWFNCSNDDIDFDSRSAKKGPEAESVTVGQIGNNTYAFIALERIGGVMVYDVTNPANAQYVNYINTRSFDQVVSGDVAPEGLSFIPANMIDNGKPMLLAANEVSGTVAAYSMDGPATMVPTPDEPQGPGTPLNPDESTSTISDTSVNKQTDSPNTGYEAESNMMLALGLTGAAALATAVALLARKCKED